MQQDLYTETAAAYVRGSCADAPADADDDTLIRFGRDKGLKMHRFKRTMGLPRVRAVIGVLKALAPQTLLDIGTGRGVFLWPLLDAFHELEVTAVDQDARRIGHLEAVRAGGIGRLAVLHHDAGDLPFDDHAFEIVSVLEVLEHQQDPVRLAKEAVRLASRFVIASVPSKEDDNPEHIQMFTGKTLSGLLTDAGAKSVKVDYVLNHIIAVARLA